VKSFRSALVLAMTCTAVAAAAAPADAATPTRRLLSGHFSLSGVQGALPAGATVSVLQFCPMRNSYTYTSDLNRKTSENTGG